MDNFCNEKQKYTYVNLMSKMTLNSSSTLRSEVNKP